MSGAAVAFDYIRTLIDTTTAGPDAWLVTNRLEGTSPAARSTCVTSSSARQPDRRPGHRAVAQSRAEVAKKVSRGCPAHSGGSGVRRTHRVSQPPACAMGGAVRSPGEWWSDHDHPPELTVRSAGFSQAARRWRSRFRTRDCQEACVECKGHAEGTIARSDPRGPRKSRSKGCESVVGTSVASKRRSQRRQRPDSPSHQGLRGRCSIASTDRARSRHQHGRSHAAPTGLSVNLRIDGRFAAP